MSAVEIGSRAWRWWTGRRGIAWGGAAHPSPASLAPCARVEALVVRTRALYLVETPYTALTGPAPYAQACAAFERYVRTRAYRQLTIAEERYVRVTLHGEVLHESVQRCVCRVWEAPRASPIDPTWPAVRLTRRLG